MARLRVMDDAGAASKVVADCMPVLRDVQRFLRGELRIQLENCCLLNSAQQPIRSTLDEDARPYVEEIETLIRRVRTIQRQCREHMLGATQSGLSRGHD